MSPKPLVHFDISERKVLLRSMDIFIVLFTLSIVGIIFQFDYFQINSNNWVWTLVLVVYLNVFASIFELYDLQKAANFEKVVQNVILTVSVTILFFMLTPFYTPSLPENRLQILFFFLSMIVALLVWRYAYITLISSARFYKKALLICDVTELDIMVNALQQADPNYTVVGYINTGIIEVNPDVISIQEFQPTNLTETIKEKHINEIVVASSATRNNKSGELLLAQLNALLIEGFSIRDYTQVYEDITHRVPVHHKDKDFYKFFLFSRSNQNKFYLFFNRVFDIFMSIHGLIVCAFLIPFMWIGNLFFNRGKLFYIQERVGRNAEVFTLYKFRTMAANAEKNGPQWTVPNDSRIKGFGKFLRRTRLDELPQFYNILKGDMSIIGPRPERPVFVRELSEMIPFYKTRHIVKPGLTGWAQVKANYGGSHTASLEKLQYDLYYIKHRGLFLDFNILLKTFSTVLFFRGQ
ncbi:exopolysaccharide biosynthesis polyprenyl glycosylphosphotransferase [Gillisia sp. M10.2A]|uniref:Exopolysaccharide biosynthesis polyprenyl glycosylphosphotransferase n=1 Tax=Gillisia lutea TaxID=2909668 RepID=A0ABS9EH17_9FLAO|nr:exopolysaccharide biosynthesis polyprenyl glycosylphosphotransferase [Gillisia lutea]MCF4102141.1 exopolysaccharide biosynthesis polyprenyl glycosylphosphotransferase [Gillisia lutea]